MSSARVGRRRDERRARPCLLERRFMVRRADAQALGAGGFGAAALALRRDCVDKGDGARRVSKAWAAPVSVSKPRVFTGSGSQDATLGVPGQRAPHPVTQRVHARATRVPKCMTSPSARLRERCWPQPCTVLRLLRQFLLPKY